MKSTMAGSEVVKITAAQTATKHGTVQGQVDKASPWTAFVAYGSLDRVSSRRCKTRRWRGS
jgi:hypothetical protein